MTPKLVDPLWIRARKIFGGVVLALTIAALAVVLWLVLPGTPSRSSVLEFKGYTELPGPRTLNVLDYMTVVGNQLFVTGESTGKVYRVDLEAGGPVSDAPVTVMDGLPSAHGVALLPAGNLAFVSRSDANTVDAFDPESMTPLKSIPVAEDADGMLYDPSSDLIYVVHGDASLATLIDPKSLETVATIKLGGKPEFQVLDPVMHMLYQNLADTNQVAEVDLKQRAVIAQWPLTGCLGPSGLAIDETARRLFAVCSKNAKLVVFNLDTHQVIATLPLGGGPDAVAYDRTLHQIYTAGKDGRLDVVWQRDADHYDLVDSIRTHYGAHTLALDPQTHNVYVGYASLFVSPRVAVFSPKP